MQIFHRRPLSLVATAMLLALNVFPASANSPVRPKAAPVKITTAMILVTPADATLYVFASDRPNKSVCYTAGQCVKYWPALTVPKGTRPAPHLPGVPGTFGVIVRADGKWQLTYDRAPLYTFVGDTKPGEMIGQGLHVNGGYWWVVVAGGK